MSKKKKIQKLRGKVVESAVPYSQLNSDSAKKSSDENETESSASSKANLTHLMSEARSSLFQFSRDLDFIEDEKESKAVASEETVQELGLESENLKTLLASESYAENTSTDEDFSDEESNAERINADESDSNVDEDKSLGTTETEDTLFAVTQSEELPSEDRISEADLNSEIANSELASFETITASGDGFLPDFNEAEENSAFQTGGLAEDPAVESTLLFTGDTLESTSELDTEPSVNLEGSELAQFDSVEIEELEFVSEDQLQSVIESILFASDRPVSLASIKQVFLGTNVNNARIKGMIEKLKSHYAAHSSGVSLEDVGSGFQLRTKLDNMEFLRRSLKAKPFKLSGPALEVLAIVAYKQPTVKNEIDQIRGVESGHLLRALMEKNLVIFAGKSDLPGKPMQYVTSRKFLEIFSLRNLKELPTLSQIDELLPEGIGEEEIQKPKLHDITEGLSQQAGMSYSEGEEELNKITDQLQEIQTSSDFFEQEKIRQREQRDAERAQNIREALAIGETVSTRDLNWLKRFEEKPAENSTFEGAMVENLASESATLEEGKIFSEVASDNDSMVMDEAEELDQASWADPEIMEANDLADIDGVDGNDPEILN